MITGNHYLAAGPNTCNGRPRPSEEETKGPGPSKSQGQGAKTRKKRFRRAKLKRLALEDQERMLRSQDLRLYESAQLHALYSRIDVDVDTAFSLGDGELRAYPMRLAADELRQQQQQQQQMLHDLLATQAGGDGSKPAVGVVAEADMTPSSEYQHVVATVNDGDDSLAATAPQSQSVSSTLCPGVLLESSGADVGFAREEAMQPFWSPSVAHGWLSVTPSLQAMPEHAPLDRCLLQSHAQWVDNLSDEDDGDRSEDSDRRTPVTPGQMGADGDGDVGEAVAADTATDIERADWSLDARPITQSQSVGIGGLELDMAVQLASSDA
ncbi:hypothetical protein KEM52_005261 [Ascosphaera acerosa]|nr:hypothetical protein KEM52_005261 [Ascosphaera acerosa]